MHYTERDRGISIAAMHKMGHNGFGCTYHPSRVGECPILQKAKMLTRDHIESVVAEGVAREAS